ncbi:MAG: cell wall hydrolase [Candidatus Thermoplasmatota archaeon]|nr:cell wall hydrolase [Candidatus Thermoplasmatota archaeon]
MFHKILISFALLLTLVNPLGNSNNANAVKVVSNTPLDNDVFTQKYYQQYIKSDRDKQHECLAKNIYFEARNEPFAGQFAVALVTLNRVHDTAFPNTICEVVYQGIHHADGFPKRDRCQFSWYCDGNSDEVRNKRAWEVVQKTANLAMLQYSSIKAEGLDYTEGARYYHTYEISPRWSKTFPKVGRIGDHIFYR